MTTRDDIVAKLAPEAFEAATDAARELVEYDSVFEHGDAGDLYETMTVSNMEEVVAQAIAASSKRSQRRRPEGSIQASRRNLTATSDQQVPTGGPHRT